MNDELKAQLRLKIKNLEKELARNAEILASYRDKQRNINRKYRQLTEELDRTQLTLLFGNVKSVVITEKMRIHVKPQLGDGWEHYFRVGERAEFVSVEVENNRIRLTQEKDGANLYFHFPLDLVLEALKESGK